LYYHASAIGGLSVLRPRISNHHIPLVYFSRKRENVLVYLSNAVEKFCKENGFQHAGPWYKWASYGFDQDGLQRVEEYYPNALADTYQGVSGYIYSAEIVHDCGFQTHIPDAAASDAPVAVSACEFVEDAYTAILSAEEQGLIKILRYQEMPDKMHAWLEKTTKMEYENAGGQPDYRFFLERKFGKLLQ